MNVAHWACLAHSPRDGEIVGRFDCQTPDHCQQVDATHSHETPAQHTNLARHGACFVQGIITNRSTVIFGLGARSGECLLCPNDLPCGENLRSRIMDRKVQGNL